MATFIQTSGGFLRALKVIFWSLFTGQFIFACVSFYINRYHPIDYSGVNHPNDVFSYIVPMLILSGIIGGYFLSQRAIQHAKEKHSFKEKLISYRSALIIRYALMEGPNLFCLVAYFLSSNLIFMYLSIAVMAYFLLSFPTSDKLIKDLELKEVEIDQLLDSQFQLH